MTVGFPNAKRVIILGSTGSVGRRALDVVRDFPDELRVVGLAAGRGAEALGAQAMAFRPEALAMALPADCAEAGPARHAAAELGIPLHGGPDGLSRLVAETRADIVLVATVGFAGLVPTLTALAHGTDVALANKEVLVAAGDIVVEAARATGARILPVDSEHNALFQLLGAARPAPGPPPCSMPPGVARLTLTASGGPFRGMRRCDLAHITPETALRHPTWAMGPKITIDSATLMNKGFEVLEACHLFGAPVERIDVVVHPESTVHAMIEFVDGAVMAHMGPTDMYLPIQDALLHPRRAPNPVAPLKLAELGRLTFEAPDLETFPCLAYAYQAARRGGIHPAAMNAANEVAVERFLSGDIAFLRIPELVDAALQAAGDGDGDDPLGAVLRADRLARTGARAP